MVPRLAAALLLLAVCATAQPVDNIEAMFKWVKELGGTIHAEVKLNSNGVRGLFTTKPIKKDEYVASIPAAAILNAGGLNDSFAVPTLTVLREVKAGDKSRFKPYVDMWPKPDELLNSCNLDSKYAPMWKSSYWEKNQRDWQTHLASMLAGELNPDIEYTIQEMVGNAPVSLEDLQYACAISSTRYVSTARRRRLLMAPVFDLANHDRNCQILISPYETADFLHIIAGEDMPIGTEICYSYGSLRDDYAVAHYGFLPDLENPPRLCLVDHRDHDPNSHYSHDTPPSEEPFDGTPEELKTEMERLTAIYKSVREMPDVMPPQPKGKDYAYDLLKELETRRLAAIQYEVRRLADKLNVKSEL